MRLVLSLLVCAVVAGVVGAEEEKRHKKEQRIKAIQLDRKTPVLFEKEIEPILVNKCAFCHSGNVKESKFDLSSYETMMRGGKRGPAVVPNKSAESMLAKMCAKDVRPYMPPKSEE